MFWLSYLTPCYTVYTGSRLINRYIKLPNALKFNYSRRNRGKNSYKLGNWKSRKWVWQKVESKHGGKLLVSLIICGWSYGAQILIIFPLQSKKVLTFQGSLWRNLVLFCPNMTKRTHSHIDFDTACNWNQLSNLLARLGCIWHQTLKNCWFWEASAYFC